MSAIKGSNILWNADGSIYHLGAKKGELNPRSIVVGDHKRAEALSSLFDQDKPITHKLSARLFNMYSGYYKGVPVSVVGIGMGAIMMDFFIREYAIVIDGPMAVIRLASCGMANPTLDAGTIITASKGSIYCYTNYTYYDGYLSTEGSGTIETLNLPKGSPFAKPILMTKPLMPDKKLDQLLVDALKAEKAPLHVGLNLCGESFYSTEGRVLEDHFEDENENLLEDFVKLNVDSIEMETHQLYHLAKKCKKPLLTAACAVSLVNRPIDGSPIQNVTIETYKERVTCAGRACLEALSKIILPGESAPGIPAATQ